jgi:hypothetical protein
MTIRRKSRSKEARELPARCCFPECVERRQPDGYAGREDQDHSIPIDVLLLGSVERHGRKESLQGKPAHRGTRIDNKSSYPNRPKVRLRHINRPLADVAHKTSDNEEPLHVPVRGGAAGFLDGYGNIDVALGHDRAGRRSFQSEDDGFGSRRRRCNTDRFGRTTRDLKHGGGERLKPPESTHLLFPKPPRANRSQLKQECRGAPTLGG